MIGSLFRRSCFVLLLEDSLGVVNALPDAKNTSRINSSFILLFLWNAHSWIDSSVEKNVQLVCEHHGRSACTSSLSFD
jgi:hypothetical protein